MQLGNQHTIEVRFLKYLNFAKASRKRVACAIEECCAKEATIYICHAHSEDLSTKLPQTGVIASVRFLFACFEWPEAIELCPSWP